MRGASASSSSAAREASPHIVSAPRPPRSRSSSTSHQVSAQTVDHAATPLDDHDRPVQVDVEIVQLERRPEPVRVDVHERSAADERRVRAGDHERRALHRPPHAEARRDPPCEGRLARRRAHRSARPGRRGAASAPSARRAPPCRRAGDLEAAGQWVQTAHGVRSSGRSQSGPTSTSVDTCTAPTTRQAAHADT